MRGSKTGLGTNRRVQDPHAPPAIAGRRIASRHHAWRCRLTSVKTTSLELGFSTPGHPLSVALPELPDVVWNAKGLGPKPPKPETFLALSHRSVYCEIPWGTRALALMGGASASCSDVRLGTWQVRHRSSSYIAETPMGWYRKVPLTYLRIPGAGRCDVRFWPEADVSLPGSAL